jgi:hypothetical protein
MPREITRRAGVFGKLFDLLLFISFAATALVAFAADAQPWPVSTEFLRIKTANGVETVGLLYAPLGRAPRGGVVLVHGYASNFYSGSTGHLSRGLAEHGFMTIAINTRDHDAGPKTTLFEENRWD